MTKALFHYLLSLGILLLAGFGQLYAQGHQGSAFHASTKPLVKSERASSGTVHLNHSLFLKSASSGGAENENKKSVATESEIEETESTNSKKYLESGHFFTAVLFAQSLEYLLGNLQRSLAFCKHISNISSHRWYLLFRVFRI